MKQRRDRTRNALSHRIDAEADSGGIRQARRAQADGQSGEQPPSGGALPPAT